MAAQLSLASASVTDDNGDSLGTNVPVLIRQNTLRIGASPAQTSHDDVQSVTQISRGVWEVRLPGSRILTVARSKDCGCGR